METTESQLPQKGRFLWVFVGIVVVLILLIGIGWWLTQRSTTVSLPAGSMEVGSQTQVVSDVTVARGTLGVESSVPGVKIVTHDSSEQVFNEWVKALGIPETYDGITVTFEIAEDVGKSLQVPEDPGVEVDQILLPDTWAVGQVKVINGKKTIPIFMSREFLAKVDNAYFERSVNDVDFQTLMALQVKDKDGILYTQNQIETLNRLLEGTRPLEVERVEGLHRGSLWMRLAEAVATALPVSKVSAQYECCCDLGSPVPYYECSGNGATCNPASPNCPVGETCQVAGTYCQDIGNGCASSCNVGGCCTYGCKCAGVPGEPTIRPRPGVDRAYFRMRVLFDADDDGAIDTNGEDDSVYGPGGPVCGGGMEMAISGIVFDSDHGDHVTHHTGCGAVDRPLVLLEKSPHESMKIKATAPFGYEFYAKQGDCSAMNADGEVTCGDTGPGFFDIIWGIRARPMCTISGPSVINYPGSASYVVDGAGAPFGSEIQSSLLSNYASGGSWDWEASGLEDFTGTFDCTDGAGRYYVVCNAFGVNSNPRCNGNPWCEYLPDGYPVGTADSLVCANYSPPWRDCFEQDYASPNDFMEVFCRPQCGLPGDNGETSACDASYLMDMTWNWTSVTGATAYRLQVDNNSDFSSPVYNNGTLTGLSQAVNNQAPGAYYGRVRVETGNANVCWAPGAWRSLGSMTRACPTPVPPTPVANTPTPTPYVQGFVRNHAYGAMIAGRCITT